ncbi:MAG: chemotaxis protein CheW [Bacteroidales bacterium]
MKTEKTTKMNTYLSFVLDSEVFATDVKYVLEILENRPVTKVPRTPDYIRGVINLRGSVLPVVDLRTIFNLPLKKEDKDTIIVVLSVDMNGERITLGGLVDSVSEVMEINEATIEPPPSIGSSYKAKFIEGMLKKEEDFIMLLDVDKIFSDQELSAVMDSKVQAPDAKEKDAD